MTDYNWFRWSASAEDLGQPESGLLEVSVDVCGVPDHRAERTVATVWLKESYDALVAHCRQNGLVRPDWSKVLGQLVASMSGKANCDESDYGTHRSQTWGAIEPKHCEVYFESSSSLS